MSAVGVTSDRTPEDYRTLFDRAPGIRFDGVYGVERYLVAEPSLALPAANN